MLQAMVFYGIACCVTHLYFLFLWQHWAAVSITHNQLKQLLKCSKG